MVIKQENFWGENIFVTLSTSSRHECFGTTRVAMTHRGVGDSVHVTLGWYLSLQFTKTRPSSMRKKFLPRIISQALLQLQHDDLETMAVFQHLRSTNWSHFKLLCLTIKWRRPIFGFSLLSPLPLLLHSRYVRWKEKNESFTNSFVFSLVKILNGDNFFLSFAFS